MRTVTRIDSKERQISRRGASSVLPWVVLLLIVSCARPTQRVPSLTRDMARFGYLYLNEDSWEGRQLVPVEWANLTTTPQGDGYYAELGEVTPIEWYGYLWWTWKPEWFPGHRVIAAEGYGGQWIVITPDTDVVFIVTADSYVTETQSKEQEKAIYDVINSYVLPAVTDGTKDSL